MLLISGFLGAGKTTAILDLARRLSAVGRRVGVITNDQSTDLIDTARMRHVGVHALEVAGGCFCCRLTDFVDAAEALLEEHRPDVILAEPVGSCTDLVATVVRPLRRRVPRRLMLGPLTVVVDPSRWLEVFAAEAVAAEGAPRLMERVRYIYGLQAEEGDIVALSRHDVVEDGVRARAAGEIAARFPRAKVISCSAVSGYGMDTLADALLSTETTSPGLSEINYAWYGEGEAALGWVDLRGAYASERPFDIDSTLMALAVGLREGFAEAGAEIAHVKLLVEDAGRSAVASLRTTLGAPELARASGATMSAGVLVVNARVQADPEQVERVVRDRIQRWVSQLGLVWTSGDGRAFRPAAPVPTERCPAIDGAGIMGEAS